MSKPYTYLIGWSNLNKFYYGVRCSKVCNPNDLWKKYFTSSKYVKRFREENGEPDIIQVRKTFNDKNKALIWEDKILRKMNAINDDKWLNKHVGTTFSKEIFEQNAIRLKGNKKRLGILHNEETKKILKNKRVGRTPALGMIHGVEAKKKMSEKRSNEKNPMFGKKQTEETKEKIRQKRYKYLNTENGKEFIKQLNSNPEKIRKTIEKNKGSKRTIEQKNNMSIARKKYFENLKKGDNNDKF